MDKAPLSVQLKCFLDKYGDFLANQTASSIREAIDVVEYYEQKEAREARREPYIDRVSDV